MPKRKRFTPLSKSSQKTKNQSLSDDDDFDVASEGENSIDINYGNELSSNEEKEEVLPVVDDSDEAEDEKGGDISYDESDGSDEENKEETANIDAWGKRKSTYYSADFVDEDRGRSYRDEDKEAAKAEEIDALEIQRSFLDKIHSSAFESKAFVTDEPVTEENKVITTVTDWNSISKKKKVQILMKQSPELMPILEEFKNMVSRIKELISKFVKLNEAGEQDNYIDFVKSKLQIMLHYSLNCSMYLVMKARKEFLTSHPVLDQINTFHAILRKLEEIEKGSNENPKPVKKIPELSKVKKSVSFALEEPGEAEFAEARPDVEDEKEIEQVEEPTLEKRSISYQIAKNKGLTPHRKKEYRNPRVKHRMKFKKAMVRRKGQVRTPRTETTRYGGELFGIQTHVTKSVKFK